MDQASSRSRLLLTSMRYLIVTLWRGKLQIHIGQLPKWSVVQIGNETQTCRGLVRHVDENPVTQELKADLLELGLFLRGSAKWGRSKHKKLRVRGRIEEQFTALYLRFVVADIHENSGKELGVFHAVGRLRDAGKLDPHEEEQHDMIRKWFNENLEKPTRFTASKPPFYRKQPKAISWFKDDALEHIARVRELVHILEHHGVSVLMLRTERVGYVVYEDAHQIVAEPFTNESY